MQIYLSVLGVTDGNFGNFVNQYPSDGLHFDVMELTTVANMGLPLWLIPQLRQDRPIQVHLMVQNAWDYLDILSKYRPNIVFFHPNQVESVALFVEGLHQLNIRAGIVWNEDNAQQYFNSVDEVMFMTVRPGRGGQSILLDRIPTIAKLSQSIDKPCWIDGGINSETLKLFDQCKLVGAVVGSGIQSFMTQ